MTGLIGGPKGPQQGAVSLINAIIERTRHTNFGLAVTVKVRDGGGATGAFAHHWPLCYLVAKAVDNGDFVIPDHHDVAVAVAVEVCDGCETIFGWLHQATNRGAI